MLTLPGKVALVVLSLRVRAVTLNWLELRSALMIALPVLPVAFQGFELCAWKRGLTPAIATFLISMVRIWIITPGIGILETSKLRSGCTCKRGSAFWHSAVYFGPTSALQVMISKKFNPVITPAAVLQLRGANIIGKFLNKAPKYSP